MDLLQKMLVDKSPEVERGGIYEFYEANGTTSKIALVVGAQYRKADRFISIIMLKPIAEDTHFMRDSVGIATPIGDYVCHCGMVTYVRRDRLGKLIHRISKKSRGLINTMISFELGIKDRPNNFDITGENTEPDYKKLYDQLCSKIAKEAQKNGK